MPFTLRAVQPGDRDYKLPAYMQGMVLHVMPREFVAIRPALTRTEMEVLIERLLSCFSKEEAKQQKKVYCRAGCNQKLEPSPHVNFLGLLEVGVLMKGTRQRVMPTMSTLLTLVDQLSSYRITPVMAGEGEGENVEDRKLEPLEVISLLYYRLRPVVSCGILVRLLGALAVLTCPARDIARFFASPTVQEVYNCKYTDGCLDVAHRQRQVLQEASRSAKWEVVVKRRFREGLFATPHIIRNTNRQARTQAFELLEEGLRLPDDAKVECLELSDEFMLAYLGLNDVAQLNGQDINDLMDLYIFHPLPLWSMRMVMPPGGSRIRHYSGELATAAMLRELNDTQPTDDNETMAGDAESIVTQETEDLQSQLNSSDGEEEEVVVGNEENEAPEEPSRQRRQTKEKPKPAERGKKRAAVIESSSDEGEGGGSGHGSDSEYSGSSDEKGSGDESDQPAARRYDRKEETAALVVEVPVARESRRRSPRPQQRHRDERDERRHRHDRDVHRRHHDHHGDNRRHRRHHSHRDRSRSHEGHSRRDRHGEHGGRHRRRHCTGHHHSRHGKSGSHRDRRNDGSSAVGEADVPSCSIQ